MGFFKKRVVDFSDLPDTVQMSLRTMESETGGKVRAGDYEHVLRSALIPALSPGDRIDMIVATVFRLGFDERQGVPGEFADGLVATGNDGAYFVWADAPATFVTYASIRSVDPTDVGLDVGTVPGLVVDADLRWLLIFEPTSSSGADRMRLLGARLTGGIGAIWAD